MPDLFSVSAKYAIDTCSLTELRRRYSSDVFPGVWSKVSELATSGMLTSVEDVLEELEVEDDAVLEWGLEHADIFQELSVDVQSVAKLILRDHPTLLDLKKKKSSADPFLIALAKVLGCAVVTEEKLSGGPPKKKIPDVCRVMGIECIPLLEMLKREGLRL
jgi:hypothetical protein